MRPMYINIVSELILPHDKVLEKKERFMTQDPCKYGIVFPHSYLLSLGGHPKSFPYVTLTNSCVNCK